YLCLGLNADILTRNNWGISLDLNFNHSSNGGIYQPNYGINFPTASLGILYDLQKTRVHRNPPIPVYGWRLDLNPFGSFETIPGDRRNFYGIHGLSLQAAKAIGFFNTITLGAEWVRDLAAQKTMALQGQPGVNPHRLGILLGHEFLFRKFNFTQQIGYYLYKDIAYINRIYHRWGLYYKWNAHWMGGVNLSAHRQSADFLDMRVIYSIHFKGKPGP
ncbi:MAG: acyloxyacyl hydrolase, partial [Bacteroidota bacterium]|nr:acyloxyacyl hydrolase [Bacteroidota bacterium]